jgi:2-iminobutanoate/2-iminopropanoate deaminase
MKIIRTSKMPISNGHYSQCIEHNGLLYLSGQLPINPIDKTIYPDIENQTKQVLDNIKLILNEAESTIDNVIQVRIYISEIKNWNAVNFIYSEFFRNHKPARTIVPTKALHYGCLIEIEVIAAIN